MEREDPFASLLYKVSSGSSLTALWVPGKKSSAIPWLGNQLAAETHFCIRLGTE